MEHGDSHDHGPQHRRGHSHGHSHTAGANARALTAALALTGTFLVAEIVAGVAFNSLALLSDAAHMFTDTAALAIALAAARIGERAADEARTFGYRRFEILAAAFNAILLFGAAVYIFVEAIRRLLDPEPVAATGMLVTAALGLGVNLLAVRLLSGGKDRSLNVKGAYLEVWADLIGSAGVLAGAAAILLAGWRWIDPIIAVGIALWVVPRTWMLLRETTNILLEGVPSGMAVAEIRKAMLETEGVAGVHDLHVWVSGADQPSCSAHIEVRIDVDPETVQAMVARRLSESFQLQHVTLQVERNPCNHREALHA